MSPEIKTWRVVATNIKTGERRILSGCESEAEAEAIVKMAVMRRGVDVEFFKVEPETQNDRQGLLSP